MGTIALEGWTVKLFISTAAIPTRNPGPAMIGRLVNRSGQDIDKLTFSVRRTDGDDDAPLGADATVSRPNAGGRSATRPAAKLDDGSGVEWRMVFDSGTDDFGSLRNDEELEFTVDLTGADGTEVDFFATPSKKSGKRYADLLVLAELDHESPTLTSTLEAPAHAHASLRIRNVDRKGKNITTLNGEILSSESGIGLSSMNLYYAHGPYTPEGTSIRVNGNQFTITGFKELVPGISCDLLVGLTDPSQEAYSLKVTGTF